jgi:hypothetical protein
MAERQSQGSEWKPVAGNQSKKVHSRIEYEDFFRIVSGRFLADYQRRDVTPRVIIWYGDVLRLQDPQDPKIFRWEKFGRTRPKNKIRFEDVKSWEIKLDFLWRHTHWGNALIQLCEEEKRVEADPLLIPDGCKKAPTTARTLKKVISSFFKGEPDPRWTKEFQERIYPKERKPSDRNVRSRRFLEMLKTVDGVFSQRFTSFPHEEWTYEKYDLFVLGLIWELISDEFLDGQLTGFAQAIDTRFAELKSARGEFKYHAGRDSMSDISNTALFSRRGRWLRSLFLPLYQRWERTTDEVQKVYLHGVLCQTRCAGKPPPLSKLQTKKKTLLVLTTPDDTNPVKVKIVGAIMEELIKELPDHAFTGLGTKAGISATSSACWEHTQREEGTLQALQDICNDRAHGVRAKTFDLNTGTPLGFLDDTESEGTYIFWRCFEEVIHMPPEERKKASLVITDEPGKNRAVTKAVACVKVVFDFVNKICSVPLERGFDSSHSGMKKANHMWNFFKDFEQKPIRDILFSEKSRKVDEYNHSMRIEVEYEDVFGVSTDYETATDYISHLIGKVIAYPWMLKCGIPKVLRDLVCEIAFQSRPIYFSGDIGVGKYIGEENGIPKFFIETTRGVLMGDPLTKVVLHFTNIVSRRLAWRIFQEDFLQGVFKTSQSYENIKRFLANHKINVPRHPYGQ